MNNTINSFLYSFLFLLLFCAACQSVKAQKHIVTTDNLDSLLLVLDKMIVDKPTYNVLKRDRIDVLLKELTPCKSTRDLNAVYSSLFYEYSSYHLDSALIIARKRVLMAQKLGLRDSICTAQLNLAQALKGIGNYTSSIDLLKKMNVNEMHQQNKIYYYNLYNSVYELRCRDALGNDEKKKYAQLLYAYKDTLMHVHPFGSMGYYLNKCGLLQLQGHYRKALELFLQQLDITHLTAVQAYFLSDIYHHLQQDELEEYYLIQASIRDIQASNKKYMSLQRLASILYKKGDLARSYAYITCSMEDITFSKARYRIFEVTDVLPIIIAAYTDKVNAERSLIYQIGAVIVIFIVFLLIGLHLVRSRNRSLSMMRLTLKQKNEELTHLNAHLSLLNNKLGELNRIKEGYIGSLFNLCAVYIDKIDVYRTKIRNRLIAGQIKELLEFSKNEQFLEDELKDFIKQFDTIFLELFPSFVVSFNKLLDPGKQILPKENELLTPELRIYALVRLGINDSTKIAKLLHYSSQTVYNYRLRTRHKAIVPENRFVAYVQEL